MKKCAKVIIKTGLDLSLQSTVCKICFPPVSQFKVLNGLPFIVRTGQLHQSAHKIINSMHGSEDGFQKQKTLEESICSLSNKQVQDSQL